MSTKDWSLADRYLQRVLALGMTPDDTDQALMQRLNDPVFARQYAGREDYNSLRARLAERRHELFALGMTWLQFSLNLGHFNLKQAQVVTDYLESRGQGKKLPREIEYKVKECQAWAERIERGGTPTVSELIGYAVAVGWFVTFDLEEITSGGTLQRVIRRAHP